MEKNLNLFPQFLVRYPDNGIKNEEDKPISISEDDFELSLFAIDSLLHVMNISLPIQQSPEAVIEFTDAQKFPMCVRTTKTIYLTSSPNDWAKTCYQLAHEMCHYMIPNDVVSTLQWLEETICELASCYFLPEISEYWKRLAIFKPAPDKVFDYNTFKTYIEECLKEKSIFSLKLLAPDTVHSFVPTLEENCTLREINRYIVFRLLPIFKHFPEVWHAVPLLSELNANQPLLDALKQWATLAPTESYIALQEVAQLFVAAVLLD